LKKDQADKDKKDWIFLQCKCLTATVAVKEFLTVKELPVTYMIRIIQKKIEVRIG